MAKVEKFLCDICGAERKQANHWFTVHLGVDSIGLFRWPMGAAAENVLHLCGEQCLQKQVAKWANQ